MLEKDHPTLLQTLGQQTPSSINIFFEISVFWIKYCPFLHLSPNLNYKGQTVTTPALEAMTPFPQHRGSLISHRAKRKEWEKSTTVCQGTRSPKCLAWSPEPPLRPPAPSLGQSSDLGPQAWLTTPRQVPSGPCVVAELLCVHPGLDVLALFSLPPSRWARRNSHALPGLVCSVSFCYFVFWSMAKPLHVLPFLLLLNTRSVSLLWLYVVKARDEACRGVQLELFPSSMKKIRIIWNIREE